MSPFDVGLMDTSRVPGSSAAAPGPPPTSPATEWLLKWSGGDPNALNRVIPLVYEELRRLANFHFRNSPGDTTLSPTGLVHEAYLRLADRPGVRVESRAHFCAIAAHVMRCILVDRSRRRNAAKRGGTRIRADWDDLAAAPQSRDLDFVALDDALRSLAAIDPLKSQIVELRFFGGLAVEDVGEALGLSARSVARHWSLAKAWLYTELEREGRF